MLGLCARARTDRGELSNSIYLQRLMARNARLTMHQDQLYVYETDRKGWIRKASLPWRKRLRLHPVDTPINVRSSHDIPYY